MGINLHENPICFELQWLLSFEFCLIRVLEDVLCTQMILLKGILVSELSGKNGV